MKVSEFKARVWDNDLIPDVQTSTENELAIESQILNLFFGNRPLSVSADAKLTFWFFRLVDIPDSLLNCACIILTNTEPVTEEDKKLPPRDFVEKHMDEFEIAVQIL